MLAGFAFNTMRLVWGTLLTVIILMIVCLHAKKWTAFTRTSEFSETLHEIVLKLKWVHTARENGPSLFGYKEKTVWAKVRNYSIKKLYINGHFLFYFEGLRPTWIYWVCFPLVWLCLISPSCCVLLSPCGFLNLDFPVWFGFVWIFLASQ